MCQFDFKYTPVRYKSKLFLQELILNKPLQLYERKLPNIGDVLI